MKRFDIIIAVEGIDGAGKTTLVNLIKGELGDEVCVLSRTQKGNLGKKLIESFPLKNSHKLQIFFYIWLSYVNYFKMCLQFAHIEFREFIATKYLKKRKPRILLMDRCFLSNICYFFPEALYNKKIFNTVMILELKIYPDRIFILDEDALVAQKRDKMKKDLNWLKKTRLNYRHSVRANTLKSFPISIVSNRLSIDDKKTLIIDSINAIRRNKYGTGQNSDN